MDLYIYFRGSSLKRWAAVHLVSSLMSAALVFGSVSGWAEVKVVYSNHNNAVAFVLSSQNMHQSLRIMGGNRGIFFETAKGRTALTGKALREVTTKNSYVGDWVTDDDRTITVSILPDGQHYKMSLTARPDDGILRWGFAVQAAGEEYFTGILERVVDGNQRNSWRTGITEALNLRGQKIDMLIKPTVSMYLPFYFSSAGYGLLVEGTWPGHYDFCASDPELVQMEFEGPSLHMRVWTGPDPAAIVKANTLHVGPPVLPPKWTFTPWRWRDNHDNEEIYYDGTPVDVPYNSKVVEDVLLMEYFDIPCGVYWVDRPWAIGLYGYSDFKWDSKRMPNAREMIKWIDDRGMRFVLWVAPWVMGDMAKEALDRGYYFKRQDLRSFYHRLVEFFIGRRVLVDFTNPEALRWWQINGIKKLLDDGVAGFKLDRGEEIVPKTGETKVWDGRTAREVRNDYPHLYLKAVHDIAKEVRGTDFACMPRAAYTGSTKYGIFWGGDIGSSPEGLRAAIIAAQRVAVMGYPFWGSDTGGYWQGDLDREVLARWLAFSCFSPIFEVGPTENRGFWDMRSEPNYDVESIAIWRLYAHLHKNLANYTYKHAVEAHETGMPIIRPLFLMFPEQEQAWDNWQTFMYGEDILVSPIWRKGKTEHEVYLPEGENWMDAWDGDVHKGGNTVKVSLPLHKIPIFLRKGSQMEFPNLQKIYEEGLKIAETRPDMKALQKSAFGN